MEEYVNKGIFICKIKKNDSVIPTPANNSTTKPQMTEISAGYFQQEL